MAEAGVENQERSRPEDVGTTVMWVDGHLVEPGTPVLRADDHALVGDGAFEAIRVDDRRPFALRRHLARLRRSLEPLGIEMVEARVREAIDAVLAVDREIADPSWLRVTVTGGSAPMASGSVGTVPTVIATVAPMAPWPPTTDVVICPWRRNEHGAITGLKTISYAENVIAYRHARREGADEAIFANTAGMLCEGSGSNVVAVVDGRPVTPTLASGCLPGVTRELLLEWVPELEEADVPVEELAEASEAFLTSTSRSVHAIWRVNGAELPEAPGPFTRHAADVWRQRAKLDHDP